MSIIGEFRNFAMRGNVVDMAVGVIIGAAFGKIVTSLVNDILMPPIGVLMGGIDFSDIAFTLKAAAAGTGAVKINVGVFINTILDFIIVAFTIFMLIKQMNRFMIKKEAEPEAPLVKECPRCISAISVKATRCPHCTSEL